MDERGSITESVDFAVKIPLTFLEAGFNLYQARSRALASYWEALNSARKPGDIVDLQVDYWTNMLRDYAEAMTNGVGQAAEASEELSARTVGEAGRTARRAA